MTPRRPTDWSIARAPALGLAIYGAAMVVLDDPVLEVAAGVVGAALSVFWPDQVELDTDFCASCPHERQHHHGPCQACLREQVAGRSDRVPCGRFRTD